MSEPFSVVAIAASIFANITTEVILSNASRAENTRVGKLLKKVGLIKPSFDDTLETVVVEALELYFKEYPQYNITGIRACLQEPTIAREIGDYVLNGKPIVEADVEVTLLDFFRDNKVHGITTVMLKTWKLDLKDVVPDFLECFHKTLNKHLGMPQMALLQTIIAGDEPLLGELEKRSEGHLKEFVGDVLRQSVIYLEDRLLEQREMLESLTEFTQTLDNKQQVASEKSLKQAQQTYKTINAEFTVLKDMLLAQNQMGDEQWIASEEQLTNIEQEYQAIKVELAHIKQLLKLINISKKQSDEQADTALVTTSDEFLSTITPNQRRRLQERLDALQKPLALYDARIVAIEVDIADALEEQRRVVYEARLNDLIQNRQKLLDEQAEIERQLFNKTDVDLKNTPNTVKKDILNPPASEYSPSTFSGGGLEAEDKFYVRREADKKLEGWLIRKGTTIVIRAPRQTGKTSLLTRGCYYAKGNKVKIVQLSFQQLSNDQLGSEKRCLQWLAANICRELAVPIRKVTEAWDDILGPESSLTYFMEDYILSKIEGQLVLALDEVDNLLETDFYKNFFALLRSWHDLRSYKPLWKKLNVVLVISTNPYLLINSVRQSPFNVADATTLNLEDFTPLQVSHLNQLYGNPLSLEDIPDFMALLNGHPYLTRLALYTLVAEGIKWSALRATIKNDDNIFNAHLRDYFEIIRKNSILIEELKQIIKTKHCSNEEHCFRLMRAGLIKKVGDYYDYRCELYRVYFEGQLL